MPASNVVIAGVRTIHQRQWWEDDAWPVAGPLATGVYEDFVGHYPGAGDVPDHDYRGHVYVDPAKFRDDLGGYYRQMQQSYAKPKAAGGRGYSVGYQLGIDYLGGLTVLRGFEFRNAANAGGKLPGNWNLRSGSAQFVTDLTEPATDLALYTFAMVVAHLRHFGHRATVRTHDYGEWTSCPGAVGAQLRAGLGEPAHWQRVGPPAGAAPLPPYLGGNPSPKPPTPPTGGHSVFLKLIRLEGTNAVYQQFSGGYKTWVRGEQALKALQALGAGAVEVIPAGMTALFEATGHIQGPIPAGVDAWGLPL